MKFFETLSILYPYSIYFSGKHRLFGFNEHRNNFFRNIYISIAEKAFHLHFFKTKELENGMNVESLLAQETENSI